MTDMRQQLYDYGTQRFPTAHKSQENSS